MPYKIYFRNSNMGTQTVELHNLEDFMKVVQANGHRYTEADCPTGNPDTHLYAWRLLNETQWNRGAFSEAIRNSCRNSGFEPGEFNVQQVRGMLDEGRTLQQVVRHIYQSNPNRGSDADVSGGIWL